jgi:hypothetical protein
MTSRVYGRLFAQRYGCNLSDRDSPEKCTVDYICPPDWCHAIVTSLQPELTGAKGVSAQERDVSTVFLADSDSNATVPSVGYGVR